MDMADEEDPSPNESSVPTPSGSSRLGRGALQAVGGAIPFLGGILSAAAGYWSERDQDRINDFIAAWIKMLQDEIKEKQEVLGEVIARLDMHDDELGKRVKSDEYQALLRKAFRNWAGAESAKKREYIRNILSNAAAVRLVTDDVIVLFLDWLQRYSEFHFAVIADIYNNPGTTRAETWERLGKPEVREDSAEADLFKLLVRDLSTGGVIRQHRETDYHGNFVPKTPQRRPRGSGPRPVKSAFDDSEQYELTALGSQFVHYAMTEVSTKISYTPSPSTKETAAT
jgi:hypothetical protein